MAINLSKAVRQNLLSLQSTAAAMAKTQERLATGLKVNSALDNPSNFFTASSLRSRAGDMSNLLDAMSNGVKTLEAADNGLTAISKTVESMQSTLRQVRQDKSFQAQSFGLDSAIGTSSLKSLTFSGGSVGSAPVSVALNTTGAGSPASAASITGGAFTPIDFTNGGANNGKIEFDLALDGNFSTHISIDYATVLGNVADPHAVTVGELAQFINADVGPGFAADDGTGKLVFNSQITGGNSSIAITNFSATNGATGSGISNASDTGDALVPPGAVKSVDTLVQSINSNSALADKIRASNDNGKLRIENLSTSDLTVGGLDTDGEASGGGQTATIGGNSTRRALVKQFNDLRDQLDKFSDDASFNGINLLRGDKLKLTFNETGSSTIDIQAKDASGSASSINNQTLGIAEATNADFDSDAGIDKRLDVLKTALGTLRSQSSAFGSNLSIVENRTDFTKRMVNTLETGAADLTLADTNEEAANLLALQTRQQLSSTALSMASQADQAVLRLFQ
jgi:flagellin-like hook-associated protein FlgL